MRTFIYSLLLIFVLACQRAKVHNSRVVVHLSGSSADSVFLRKISLDNTPSHKIDSGLLRYSKDSLVFDLPFSSDILFQFSLEFSGNLVYCIPDASEIHILMNMKNGKNSITGSPSSMSLIKFTEEQDSLAHRMQMLVADQNLLNKADKEDAINFQRAVADLYKITQERFRNFADSVSSSAAFMENFDHIDFENDFTGMKHLVDNAMKRFPNAAGISRLDSQVSKLIHILEKELKIGDVFPSLQLPDFDGHLYSTDSNKGKFVFIDFWSSWCPNCMIYDKVRQNIKEDNHFGNLVLIHVALDDHVSLCREIVETNKMSGVQLIDTDIWQGQTSEKLAFDSIPFNFLLSPDHHILAKGIPADSILPLLRKYIR